MALTKEERSELAKLRNQQRREENEAMERKYPSAVIHRYRDEANNTEFLQLRLNPEEPMRLTVRFKGNWLYPEATYPEVQATYIRLNDPHALACLIRGLVCRYNAMIGELNEEVEAMPSLETARTWGEGAGPLL